MRITTWVGTASQAVIRAAALALPAVLAAQDPFAGSWRGYWTRAGDTLPVTMALRWTPAGLAGSFSSDRLRVDGIPFAEVRANGCCDLTLVLRGDATTAVFTGRLRGDSLTGEFREAGTAGRFALGRTAPPPPLAEREVQIQHGDVTLAGTLIRPILPGGPPAPAVVFLHGSGAEGRWASRFLALQVVARGFAALIWDKRGVGGSTGDWRAATPEDLVADAAAAVAFLAADPAVDPARIGIHGHSQGGTLAPYVAVRAPVAFVIGSAAGGVPLDSIEVFSVANAVLGAAVSAADSAACRAFIAELVAVAYGGAPRARLDSLAAAARDRPWLVPLPPAGDPYWRFSRDFGALRPLEQWGRVRVPVLLVYGEADQRVPAAESARRIGAALAAGGNRDVTVAIHPGADHTFRLAPGPSGWPLTAPRYVPGLLAWLARWR